MVAASATLTTNTTQTSQGQLGMTIALPSGSTFVPETTQVLVNVTFKTATVATLKTSTISFGDSPTARQIRPAYRPTGMRAPSQSTLVMKRI